ncbi:MULTISPECIES: phosphonate ABC transporter, permease protein PhnE [Pacificibacter]|uniref:phosphonate ABC transporter, permease protein PhnE n=1 Tax=Pacificibacter TaxID=1042323 RepID=UPI001C096788|nr:MULTISPECIES: phosphonate ABC transporter, permease protein PhnE [Pacificibacter]MBU2935662.1 phosphonate ABC transporter, permease protein PhnE [Pacificibacter marinus]MDO6614158.1 phosphonate ABC transporter, permease protein PhnE [Pacificibacter sp. 1_MG-2023]
MTASTTDIHTSVLPLFQRKRVTAIAWPLVIILYLCYTLFSFDILGLGERVNLKNAQTLVSDAYSYKTHVTLDNRNGATSVSIEGERKGTYPDGTAPEWVTLGADQTADTLVDLGDGYLVTLGETVRFEIPDYGTFTATPGRTGVNATFPAGDLPNWISASKNRVAITTDAGRLSVTRNRAEVFKYAYGWELFFFTLDSPYHGMGIATLASHAFSGEAGAIANDFWTNKMWRHGDVAWALVETVLMAFLGTFGAAIIALPLGFLAARNFTPLGSLRFAARRVFDFLRGVDGLIWTIILSRAFGPGPLTGSLAILLTDTGSFGKMFSEALENVDEKQIEGISSTGAKPLQRYRFGVIPQITPVLLSQVLYYFESNTRSATIIGAITGGGIGLLLTQAIATQKDWEEVSYYIVLIILLVMSMDSLSGWLRNKLIKGDEGGH